MLSASMSAPSNLATVLIGSRARLAERLLRLAARLQRDCNRAPSANYEGNVEGIGKAEMKRPRLRINKY